MKKITFIGAMLITASSLFSQSQFKWNGSQTTQEWDYATANWLDPNFPIPIPKTFVEGSDAIFDDSSVEGSDTIKVNGTITVDSIKINATKNYVIRRTADTDVLAGNGTLIKDGAGTYVMDVKSTLLGGTVLRNGKLMMEKQTTPNIFGAKLVFEGGIANFATTTASTYPSITLPVEIPAGKTATVELSRYSYWSSPITGNGDLKIFAGGERTYLGAKNVQPDWSAYTGNVTVEKYVMAGVSPGFHGLILNTNRTFKDSLDGFGIDSTFYNRKLTLGNGVTIGAESGNRVYAVGELNSTDTASLVGGYYKDSTTPKIQYMIGGLNTDVTYPGRIGYIGSKAYNQTGIIKIGTGTYTFTNNNNLITSGIAVREGRVLINDKNLRGNKNGGTGAGVSVKKAGILGGTGRIAGAVDVYGTLQPGADGIGTLTLSDSISANPMSKYGTPFKYSISYKSSATATATFTYVNGGMRATDLILREGSVSEFELASATSYDKLNVSGKIRFSKDTLSAGKPKIKIKLVNGYTTKDGDSFEIIAAKSLDVLSNGFDIEYPAVEGVTWSVETKADTVNLDVEKFTFVDHIKSFTNVDSVVTTIASPDSVKISYKVIVKAHGGTSVNSLKDNSTISMYPNPSVGDVNFTSSEAEITSIEIINLQGQVILRRTVGSTIANLNLDKLSTGIYYAKVITSKGTHIQKLMLQ